MAAGQVRTRKLPMYLGNNFKFQSVFSHEMKTDVVADEATETIPIEFDESTAVLFKLTVTVTEMAK